MEREHNKWNEDEIEYYFDLSQDFFNDVDQRTLKAYQTKWKEQEDQISHLQQDNNSKTTTIDIQQQQITNLERENKKLKEGELIDSNQIIDANVIYSSTL